MIRQLASQRALAAPASERFFEHGVDLQVGPFVLGIDGIERLEGTVIVCWYNFTPEIVQDELASLARFDNCHRMAYWRLARGMYLTDDQPGSRHVEPDT